MNIRRLQGLSRCLAAVMVLASLLVLALPAPAAKAAVVTFTDPNLEAAVREAISKPTGAIEDTDLVGLTDLDAGGRSIHNLGGIEHCTGLTHLILYYNSISDVSLLSGLTGLAYLDLQGNLISSISPLSTLTNLTLLILDENQISDLSPLSGLGSLDDLSLGGNLVGDNLTPLAGLTGLGYLSLYQNQITDLTPLAGLTGLNALFLQGNQITDLTPLAGLTGLELLDLNNNQVSDISPLDNLTAMSMLYLDNNQISDISALDNMTSLSYLWVRGNQVTSLAPLSGLAGLGYLAVGENQISDLSPLAGLTGLHELYLQDNQISDLSPLAGLTDLEYLFLGINLVDNVTPLTGLTGLLGLYLHDNQITDISALSGMTSLVVLDLARNQVSDLTPLAGRTSLVLLYVEENQVSDLTPLAGLTGLSVLHLGDNDITGIQVLVDNTGLGSGDEVDLRGNLLSSTCVDTWIPALEARGVTVLWDAYDTPPSQPGNSSPANGALNVGLTPALESTAFADPDPGDTHQASRWQITTVSDNYSSPVYDSGTDNMALTAITVPAALDYATTYFWRTRHQDSHGVWSDWSIQTSFTTIPTTPLITTGPASGITTTGARLNGTLTSLGTAPSVTVSFAWGTSPGSYPNETAGQVMTAPGAFYFDLGGFSPGSPCYYQARGVGNGSGYGLEMAFSTLPAVPLVTTGAASGITGAGARLNGTLTSLGTAASVTVTFAWGTSPGSYGNDTTGQAMTGTGAFYADLAGLAPGTTYYYQARAVGDGAASGTESSFTTATAPPAVATGDASGVAAGSARLNGDLTALGTAGSVTVSFVWGTSPGSLPNETAGQALAAPGAFYFDLSGLVPGTYYYQARAAGHGAPVLGVEKGFTVAPPAPEVQEVDPDSGKRGERLTVIISGVHFDGVTAVGFGSGVTVEDFSVDGTGTEITVTIAIDDEAELAERLVWVTTPGGTVPGPAVFTVNEASTGTPAWVYVLIAAGVLAGSGFLAFLAMRLRQKPMA